MRKNAKLACTVFILLLILAQGTILAQGDVIRLHVVANSDSSQDQRIKEVVRDRFIAEFGPRLDAMNQREATAWVLANLETLARLAASVLEENDATYLAQVKLRVEGYPIRSYRWRVYPEGKYRSVQVILGDGQGQNWWCLLFPPLCFVNETVCEPAEEDQDIEVRFWLWEKVRSFICGILGL